MRKKFKTLGCARFPEILQNFSERQILWSLCSVVFHALTLKLPIQTSLSVVPKLPVPLRSSENCPNFRKTSTPLLLKYLKPGNKARTIDKKPIGPCTQRCTAMDGNSWQGNSNSGWKERLHGHHFQSLVSFIATYYRPIANLSEGNMKAISVCL